MTKLNHIFCTIGISVISLGCLDSFAEDLGNGTFSNPVIWADLPDPDVIRVGDTYYMVSTTMHLMPGAPVMKSKDLVNWEHASYIFNTLDDNGRYNLFDGTVYGKGQWATSLKYHKGKFYALFSPNDEPYRSYIFSTKNPSKEGSWKLVSRPPHFHDCSLFFDEDDRVYTISGSGDIILTELKNDLSDVKEDGVNIHLNLRDDEETNLLEGSRMVKHDGKYYLMIISWPQGKPRRQLCYRADKITGPYEKQVVLEENFAGFGYVGQGTIVDDTKGNWWGMIFQDRGAVGRVLTLSPVTWENGWPMIDHVPEIAAKPEGKTLNHSIVTSDDFNGKKLKREWEWNHNPELASISLTDRKGWLRLSTPRNSVSSLYHAPNTLTQRMEGPVCQGYVKLDISNMLPGDKAGLAAFNGHTGAITVNCTENGHFLTMNSQVVNLEREGTRISGVHNTELGYVNIPDDKTGSVYLKVDADFNLGKDMARFSYSYDGANWTPLGIPFQMKFDYRKLFMGTRLAIFNYATEKAGGYIDCDIFEYGKKD